MNSDTSADGSLLQDIPAWKKSLKITGWIAFSLFCLTFFTLIKFPDAKLKGYIQGSIANALSPYGISLMAEKSEIGIFLGLSYKMSGVTLLAPNTDTPIRIENLEVSPSFIKLIFGKLGGSLWLQNGKGKLKGSFSLTNSPTGGDIGLDLTASKLDLGKLGVLPLLASLQGGAILDGNIEFSGDINKPSSLNGKFDLKIADLAVDNQQAGFLTIPSIKVKESILDILITGGKVTLKSVKIGKSIASGDDLVASGTGDITLGKSIDSSTLNLKAKIALSERVGKAFSILDALWAAGKQSDGSYSLMFSGPLMSPTTTPATN